MLRSRGSAHKEAMSIPQTLSRADLLAIWPDYMPTPLVSEPGLAAAAGVGQVLLKLEGHRPFGNFKALGGMIAGLKAIGRAVHAPSLAGLIARPRAYGPLPGLLCASDGNHGLAVAAAAARVGAHASIYLPVSVPQARSDRIEALGGEVIRIDGTYDDAVEAAERAGRRGRGLLVPDTSQVDSQAVRDVMAGYSVLTREITRAVADAVQDPPTHQFIQAGVGGLAAAMAQGLGSGTPSGPQLIVVEPVTAACVARALQVGRCEKAPGDLRTSADMLSCGLASAPALAVLLSHGARAVTVDEGQLGHAVDLLQRMTGVETTASGAAGLAGLMAVAGNPAARDRHALSIESRVLLVVTEGSGHHAATEPSTPVDRPVP